MTIIRKKPRYSETLIQQAIVRFVRAKYDCIIVSRPNENDGSVSCNVRLKSLGRLAGMPDLDIFWIADKWDDVGAKWPSPRVAFMEIKSDTGRLTETQKKMHQQLSNLGLEVGVVRSLIEADEFLKGLGVPVKNKFG